LAIERLAKRWQHYFQPCPARASWLEHTDLDLDCTGLAVKPVLPESLLSAPVERLKMIHLESPFRFLPALCGTAPELNQRAALSDVYVTNSPFTMYPIILFLQPIRERLRGLSTKSDLTARKLQKLILSTFFSEHMRSA
jgi:hypothetical protein